MQPARFGELMQRAAAFSKGVWGCEVFSYSACASLCAGHCQLAQVLVEPSSFVVGVPCCAGGLETLP